MVKFRKATSDDLYSVYEIEKACFDAECFSLRQFRYLLNKAKSVFMVAEETGTIVGYIVLLRKNNVNGLRIYSIAISPDHRKKGIARQLLDEAERQTVEMKLAFLYLEVSEENKEARSLYEQAGFTDVGFIPSYYHDGSAAIQMRKVLQTKSM
jgi:ribosomal-protein-alanine acetyltransferase